MTREEAEQILEDNPEHGSIILRPSTLANNYALTLRQLTPRSDGTSRPLIVINGLIFYVRAVLFCSSESSDKYMHRNRSIHFATTSAHDIFDRNPPPCVSVGLS